MTRMEIGGMSMDVGNLPLRDRIAVFARTLNGAIRHAEHSSILPEEKDTLRHFFGSVVSYQLRANSGYPDSEEVQAARDAMFEAERTVRVLASNGSRTNVHNMAVGLLNTKARLFSR